MNFPFNLSHPFRTPRQAMSHASALPALAMNRILGFASSAVIGVFFPIFLFEFFGRNIQFVLLFYAVNFLVKLPVLVWGAKAFSRIGLNASMVIGTMGIVVSFFSAYALDAGTGAPLAWLAILVAGFAVSSGFYWAPFHVDFANMISKGRRGVQISRYFAAEQAVGILAPVIGGFVISMYAFQASFLLAILLQLLSLVPLTFLKKTRVTFEFGFFETFRKMFARRYRNMAVAMMANGAENIVGVAVWPIFLFLIFEGRYLDIGAFAAAIVVVSLMLELLVGKETDRKPGFRKKALRLGTDVYAFGWLVKALVSSVVGVFAASTFHSFGSVLLRTPLSAIMYEQASDAGHYIDEFTTIREIALNLGRFLMMLLLILLMAFFSIPAAFVVAAVASLGMSRIAKAVA